MQVWRNEFELSPQTQIYFVRNLTGDGAHASAMDAILCENNLCLK